MQESILEEFFNNAISAEFLSKDVKNTITRESYDSINVNVIEYEGDEKFKLESRHLIMLCEGFISGHLSREDIRAIAMGLNFSKHFYWDEETEEGQIIETVVFDWDNPEINFPVTIENMERWKYYLETGEYTLY